MGTKKMYMVPLGTSQATQSGLLGRRAHRGEVARDGCTATRVFSLWPSGWPNHEHQPATAGHCLARATAHPSGPYDREAAGFNRPVRASRMAASGLRPWGGRLTQWSRDRR